MLATPIIKTLSFAVLDVGHLKGPNKQILIGAAVLTAELQGPKIHFNLDSCVLQPSDASDILINWLDQHLTAEGATITGYRINDARMLLERLPGAGWSQSLKTLSGCSQQYLYDLSASENGQLLTFQQACAQSQILCAPVDPDRRVECWMRAEVDDIKHDTQIDALAAFRLVMSRFIAVNPARRNIATTIGSHFAVWLEKADCSAARLHVADLLSND